MHCVIHCVFRDGELPVAWATLINAMRDVDLIRAFLVLETLLLLLLLQLLLLQLLLLLLPLLPAPARTLPLNQVWRWIVDHRECLGD